MRAPYRLGIDIGSNSLGWCVFDLDKDNGPRGIRRMGVRIFTDGRDPQKGTSLAADRRLPRQQRRRRDRYLDRRADLIRALVRHGLMPADDAERKKLESLDPYELRARGLDEALPLHHLGRAIFHLNQRRGFRSSRKTERGGDEKAAKEAEGMKGAIRSLEAKLDGRTPGLRTLGEYLWVNFRKDRSVRGSKDGSVQAMSAVRTRPRVVKGKNAYDLYYSRAMFEREFAVLWAAQARFHPELTDAMRDEIADIVFFQRKLLPVDPGPCTFEEGEPRAPLALPIQQDFRILQELANLELVERTTQKGRRLTRGERDRLYDALKRKDKVTFDSIRKTVLKIGDGWTFNLEDERRKDLKGDAVSKQLGDKKCFGDAWFEMSEARQTEIVGILLDEEDEAALIARATTDWGLAEANAKAVAAVRLPEGFGRLSLKALRNIVPLLRDGVAEDGGLLGYAEAAERAGYHHSDFRTGEIMDALPYYGQVLSRYTAPVRSPSAPADERRHGRIANPTVHIALNETRKLINGLIGRYGHPESVVVELARDLKLNKEQKDDIRRQQAENQRKNDERRAKLAEIGEAGRTDGILRLRLWEELNPAEPHNRRCVYTGEAISIRRLFSDEVEIEHILPFKQFLDDSPANLTVSLRRANRDKGNRTPWEAFHADPNYDWPAIMARVADLPKNKRWRFREDAPDIVRDKARRALLRERNELPPDVLKEIEAAGAFLGRQLIDTAYLARLVRQYLWNACNPNQVWVTPGTLTGLLRRKWGLNRLLYGNRPDPEEGGEAGATLAKRRDNHLHHAIDAFVIGVTGRGMLQQVSTAADQVRDRLIDDMPEPWEGFREQLAERLGRIVVSYRPDHGKAGRLHEETAYGIVADPAKEGGATLVYRKALVDLNANEIERIRDRALRDRVKAEVAPDGKGAKEIKEALAAFADRHGIRRVRLLKTEEGFIPINGGNGAPYKAVLAGDNHHIDIFALPDGRWAGEAVSIFDANRRNYRPRWVDEHPDALLVMRVHKGDLICLRHEGRDRIMRIVRLNAKAQRLYLAEHLEAGNLADRHEDTNDPFRWLLASFTRMRELGARKVTVDALGRVNDPGFKS
jgi:CRISPR-associated endonuclease Csn1